MDEDVWIAKLRSLRVERDKLKGDSPLKPLLILAFLDMVESGEYADGGLTLSRELKFRFHTLYKIVERRRSAGSTAPPRPPDIRLPFFALATDEVWAIVPREGPQKKARDRVDYVLPAPAFLSCCQRDSFRRNARMALIQTYFAEYPDEQIALYYAVGLVLPEYEGLVPDEQIPSPAGAVKIGRSARFRLEVVPAYGYMCALTGYRMTTAASSDIVEAAHIHEFSESRNNEICNGIALTPNAHWQFDNGLWTIDESYQVRVATSRFEEHCPPHQTPLSHFDGTKIVLPENSAYWPSQVHLAWHREHRFNSDY